ncbi:hypothetical protein T484DRAFT_1922851, partial [Baffinella frigidus]
MPARWRQISAIGGLMLVDVALGGTAVAVVFGGMSTHSCAALTDGSLKFWGMNEDGQLGDDTTTDRYTP